MIIVGKSSCVCGICGTQMKIEWDLEPIGFDEGSMGVRMYYESEEEVTCESCGEKISATLKMTEYPVGGMEDCSVVLNKENDSSVVEIPTIEFFDL